MKKNSVEEAIPLVVYEPEKSIYSVSPQAITFIKSIPPPLGVIGVAGMYRTGKSFLLNRMILDRSDGFGVGPTINPCTKGLWIWGSPIKGKTEDGNPINILVIDSEGIGALDEDSAHDTKIFSLTILLSSIFIYNSVGSIDENAIQNLSLVVNLTKNIQFKANTDDDTEIEDYSSYFPTFVWIIRDFTLQLVDQEGDSITSKEYLERSLAPQSGFSDDVEQKNRIRRLLTTFFQDRDCFTMVRPLLNESSLQNLDKMDLTKLRPEFYEQVLSLRKKILGKMRPKTMNGKNLSGELYVGLMNSYVKAINEGSVPNIENAWTYICREQNEKAVEETLASYEKMVVEQLVKKLPLTANDLRLQHKLVMQTAIELFKEKIMDKEAADEFIIDIRKKMKDKFEKIKIQNEKESAKVCQNFIKKEWEPIDRKLKMSEYRHYAEFERDLNLFHQFLIEHGPQTINREYFFIEFIRNKLAEGALIFVKAALNESEILKTVNGEFKTKYEKEMRELKDELSKEKSNSLNKTTLMEKQKIDFERREEEFRSLSNVNLQLKEAKEKYESEFRTKLSDEQEKNKKIISELQKKLSTQEQDYSGKLRDYAFKEKEFDKEISLTRQRMENLEQMINEGKNKEREWENKYVTLKDETSLQLKDLITRSESEKRGLNMIISDLKDKIGEFENNKSNDSENWSVQKENMILREETLKKSIKEANNTIETLMKQINTMNQEAADRISKLKREFEEEKEILRSRLNDNENNLREREDILKTHRNTNEKTTALLQQKCEFLDAEVTALRQQLADTKKAHDATIRAFEMSQPDNKQNLGQKEIIEMRENYAREKKVLENELNSIKKSLNLQIEQLQEKNNELELKIKVLESDYNKDITSLKEALDQTETARQKLSSDLKSMDSQKLKIIKETEERLGVIIKELEDTIEENKKIHSQEIKDLQLKSENSLRQLREFYESEKSRLERKIIDDKEKFEKKYSSIVEEYETRIREEQVVLEDENDNLRQELRDHEIQSQSLMQQYQNELDLAQRSNENLQQLVNEAKENLSKQEENYKQDLDNLTNQWNVERNNLMDKINALTKEFNAKEKEVIGLKQKIENIEQRTNEKDELVNKLKEQYSTEIENLNKQLEEFRQKYQDLCDEYLEKKINYEKNAALSQQQIEFLKQKVDELQKILDFNIQKYEDMIRRLKEELVQEHNLRLSSIQDEKQNLEQKHEKLKRSAKDNDAAKERKLLDLERDRAILLEKNENLQTRLTELENKLSNEIHHYNLQISNIREVEENEKKPLLSDLEKFRALCLQLENEKSEVKSYYDRDRVLWEGKFNFLQQQRDQARADLSSALKNFEQTLQHLHVAQSNDPTRESSLTDLLLTIEKKYQSQIVELRENHSKFLQELEDKNKKLERELKNIKDKLLLDTHGKLGSQILNEKKLSEYMDIEKRLLSEIEQLKKDKEIKIIELQSLSDKDRIFIRKKLNEIEDKLKESELKQSSILYDHEKERAKWIIEQEHLSNQRNDLQENLVKIEKKKEILLRENEKLKNEIKSVKKNNALNQSNLQKTLNLSQHINEIMKKSPSGKSCENNIVITSTTTRTFNEE